MKKISVNKSDEVAVIVEKIIDAEDNDITLNVPRFSHISSSLSNFHLLKREADALGKRVFVESVDDRVVELAEMSGLASVNPFFAQNKRQFSDIVAPKNPKAKNKQQGKTFKTVYPDSAKFGGGNNIPIKNYQQTEEINENLPPKRGFNFNFARLRLPKFDFSFPDRNFYKKSALAILILFFAGGVFFAAARVFPRAEVKIILKKQNWNYNDSVFADKSVSAQDVGKMSVPGQVFSQKKNVQLKFPANGKRKVEKFAAGVITIYNNFSSTPQPLVVKTRFLSPDGKQFILKQGVVVPGAKVEDGQIISSSIDAEVVADKPGPDYNIAPVKYFTIPGFKETSAAKYKSFHGESAKSMSGGFIGEIAYPTAEDIKKAKDSAGSTLNDGLKTALVLQVPGEFKILDGATFYKILDQKIDEEADKEGNFGIFSDAQMTIVAFKESDLKSLLSNRAVRDNGEDLEVKSFTFEYGLARADFDRGRISFPVNYKAVLVKKISPEELKKEISGKSETELKSAIFALPGLDSATISLWPFYVKTVPSNPNKISVSVD